MKLDLEEIESTERAKTVYYFRNGNVVVLGYDGEQIDEHRVNTFNEHLSHLRSIGVVDDDTEVIFND